MVRWHSNLSRSELSRSDEENAMPNDHDDTSTSEDRYGQQRVHLYSGWASTIAITVTIVIAGAIFIYLAIHSG